MNERQAVTAATYVLTVLLLGMAWADPRLWANDLFKVILQAFAVSAIGQTILGFHFTANKSDEVKSDNSSKAFEALKSQSETINALTPNANVDKADVMLNAGETATIEARDERA